MVHDTYDGGTETPPDQLFGNYCTEIQSQIIALPSFAHRDSSDPYEYGKYNKLMSSKGVIMGYTYEQTMEVCGYRSDGSEITNVVKNYNQTGSLNRNFDDANDDTLFLNNNMFPVSLETEDMGQVWGNHTGYHIRVSEAWHPSSKGSMEYRGHFMFIQRTYENDGSAFNHPTFENLQDTVKVNPDGVPHQCIFEPVGYTKFVDGPYWKEVYGKLKLAYTSLSYVRAKEIEESMADHSQSDEIQDLLMEEGMYDLTDAAHMKVTSDQMKESVKLVSSKGRNRAKQADDYSDEVTMEIRSIMEEEWS